LTPDSKLAVDSGSGHFEGDFGPLEVTLVEVEKRLAKGFQALSY
jgi:hypothetical protein